MRFIATILRGEQPREAGCRAQLPDLRLHLLCERDRLAEVGLGQFGLARFEPIPGDFRTSNWDRSGRAQLDTSAELHAGWIVKLALRAAHRQSSPISVGRCATIAGTRSKETRLEDEGEVGLSQPEPSDSDVKFERYLLEHQVRTFWGESGRG